MALYTYDDFKKKLDSTGLVGQFSSADLSLAKRNPDAGMSILNSKIDYKNATTNEARALANANAENVRTTYGNYTAGKDGSSFTLGELTPMGYVASPSPEYENKYKDKIDSALSDVTSRTPFEYNAETDPLYQAYRKQYLREGQRAAEDALGAASAATGGVPSSYAATAAAQQGNYYSAALTDKLPELYEAAYNKYLNDFSMKRQALSDVMSVDRNEFSKYQTDLSRYNSDRDFEYGKRLDEISNQRQDRAEELQKALLAFEHGDNGRLESLGIDTTNDPIIKSRNLEYALNVASMGDYSELAKLGYDITNIPQEIQNKIALKQLEMAERELDDNLKTSAQNRWLNSEENNRQGKLTDSQLRLNDDSLKTSEQNRRLSLQENDRANRSLEDSLLSSAQSRRLSEVKGASTSQNSNYDGLYKSYVREMTASGVGEEVVDGMYTASEWNALKNSGAYDSATIYYDSYEDYANDYFDRALHYVDDEAGSGAEKKNQKFDTYSYREKHATKDGWK